MRWVLSISILLFGIFLFDNESVKWTAITIGLYSVPLMFQFYKKYDMHIWSVWFGVFLVAQSFVSILLFDQDFKTLTPNMYEIIDVRGGIPGISGKQSVTTDSHGFRITKKIDYNDDASFRIFAIGGSTTEQVYLDDKRTWTHLLQMRLTGKVPGNVEVINTGVSGLRAVHHLATLKNVIKYKPDMVIFLMGINDWNWHIKDHFNPPVKKSVLLEYRENLLLRKTLVGNVIFIGFSMINSRLKANQGPVLTIDNGEYFSKQRNSLARSDVRVFKPEKVRESYKKTFDEISDTCTQAKIICMFVTQPVGYQDSATDNFKKGFWMTPPNTSYTLDFSSMNNIATVYNEFLITESEKKGHFSCDLAGKLLPTVDNFFDDCHFNISGARNVSQHLSACVLKVLGKQGKLMSK